MKQITFIALGMALAGLIGAQPVWESGTTATGEGNAVTLNKPTGTVADNLLVVGIMFEKGSGVNALSAPAGWTLLSRTNEGGDLGMQTYYRVADGTEGASFSFTLNNGPKWSAGISRISGANITTPIDASAGTTGGGNAGINTIAPSITTTTPNTLVLAFYSNKKNATFTPASGTIERYDAPNNSSGLTSNMLATYVQAALGTTGTRTAVASVEEKWVAQKIAIRFDPLLPIELLDFAAVPAGRSSVRLSWTTASEKDNDYFSIARSADGRHWETFTELKGAGDAHSPQEYSVMDHTPHPGVNYYRLCQTDYDGSSACPRIVSLTMPAADGHDTALFPNPAMDRVVFSGFDPDAPLRIFNVAGIEVAAPLSRAGGQIEIDVSRLTPGLYYVKSGTEAHILYKR